MKKPLNIKKLVLLNLPYILMGLFATNFGEAWRMAQGADASEKALSLISVLPAALGSFWPSFHPLDLLVGLCCGAALRLAVYLKGKNAKKYRPNIEYGSARWGNSQDIAPYVDPVRLIDGFAVLVLHGLSVLIQLRRAPLEQLSTFD